MENYSSDRVRPQRATAGAARKSWERARCVLQNNQLVACNTLGQVQSSLCAHPHETGRPTTKVPKPRTPSRRLGPRIRVAPSVASRHHEVCCTICKCRLCSHHEKKLSRRDGTCHATPSPQHNIRTYPSPSRRFSGSRADTSGPSSRRNCAFQSLPRSSMNRPATRRGRIKVATAQMP